MYITIIDRRTLSSYLYQANYEAIKIMLITSTKLRTNLYKIIDKVIATGNPVEIEHHGHIVKIIAEVPKSKLANLTQHPGTIGGDPEELVHLDWYQEWSEQ